MPISILVWIPARQALEESMKFTVPRLGSSSSWWMKFSWLFLPIRVSIPMSCCSSQPLVCVWCFLCELVFLCPSLKLKETYRKGILYQWFCRVVFGGLCLGHVSNLGTSQGPSVGRDGALEAFRSSWCQQP